MIKVLELFAGIGACSKALERLGIEHEIVDAVEIDKYAIKSFNAIHGTNFGVQDITKWDKDIECDLIMHGSPCQDFSLAGKQAGGDIGSGTRSSLMYETIRIVGKSRPKYVIWENVKNVLSAKHKHNFDNYLTAMSSLGYTNYYQVLNAKDYGIPQNRERVFTISVLDDTRFQFPLKQELTLRLKDMLEETVDEKYYLSDEQVEKIKTSTFHTNAKAYTRKRLVDTLCARDWKDPKCIQVAQLPYYSYESDGRVYSPSGISPCLRSKEPNQKIDEKDIIIGSTQKHSDMQGGNRQPKVMVKSAYFRDYGSKGKLQDEICDTLQAAMGCGGGNVPLIKIKNATKKGYQEAYEDDSVNLAYPDSTTRRGRVGNQVAQTLQCNDNMGVVTSENDLRIRKLTPKECWKLMGFDDTDIDKCIEVGMSNSQLYKQAGNSIVVNVLEAILKNLIK